MNLILSHLIKNEYDSVSSHQKKVWFCLISSKKNLILSHFTEKKSCLILILTWDRTGPGWEILITESDEKESHEEWNMLKIVNCKKIKWFDIQYKIMYIENWNEWNFKFFWQLWVNFKWVSDKIMKFHCSYFNKSKLPDFFFSTLCLNNSDSLNDLNSLNKSHMISNSLTISNCRWYQTADNIKSWMISNCRWSEQPEKERDNVRDFTLTLQKSHQKKIILRSVTWLTCDASS